VDSLYSKRFAVEQGHQDAHTYGDWRKSLVAA
jgi:hypothetical protein